MISAFWLRVADKQRKLDDFSLRLNARKTQEMSVNSSSQENFTIENTTIGRVEKFCYLGRIIA